MADGMVRECEYICASYGFDFLVFLESFSLCLSKVTMVPY